MSPLPPTMSHMGDVLAGFHAAWEFQSDSVLIRFERGIRTPKLLQVLGERRIPFEAIAGVTVARGRRGTVILRAEPRVGADPLMEAANGQLRDSCDPYRLVLPAERSTRAERYADELRARLTPGLPPAERHLVAAPETPRQFKAYDAKAWFDGGTVSFRWSWTGASSAKWRAGDQSYPVTALSGVEWRSPDMFEGYLRLLRPGVGGAGDSGSGGMGGDMDDVDDVGDVGVAGTVGQRPRSHPRSHPRPRPRSRPRPSQPKADQDPAAVIFGRGYGPVHESLPFAAAVLAAVNEAGPASGAGTGVGTGAGTGIGAGTVPAATATAMRADPADIAERIRHLGELHAAGLVTDAEFAAKKAELLAEL